MLKFEERKLKTESAIKIADNLLEVFKYCINRAGIIYTSYPCCDEKTNKEEEKQSFYREIYISDRVLSGIKIKKCKKKDKDDLRKKHNTYYIHYKTHDYEINFYDNPKMVNIYYDPMSYDVIEQYNEETDILCNIVALNSKGGMTRMMQFTFNIESMNFLYLYDICSSYIKTEDEFVLNKDTGKFEQSATLILEKAYYTKTLVMHLQNRVLAEVFKFDDTL